jgi:hypothetical protein
MISIGNPYPLGAQRGKGLTRTANRNLKAYPGTPSRIPGSYSKKTTPEPKTLQKCHPGPRQPQTFSLILNDVAESVWAENRDKVQFPVMAG